MGSCRYAAQGSRHAPRDEEHHAERDDYVGCGPAALYHYAQFCLRGVRILYQAAAWSDSMVAVRVANRAVSQVKSRKRK